MREADDRAKIRHALEAIPFLADALDGHQLDALAARCRMAHFPAGAILMVQGDFGSAMYGIVEGTVEVTYTDMHERARDVARLSAGEIVGEIALLTGDRRTASVSAVVPVAAVEITKSTIEWLIVEDPDIVASFAATLAARHAALEKIERESGPRPVEEFLHLIRRVFRGLFGGDEAARP